MDNKKDSFESNLLWVFCLLGLIRSLIALVRDNPQTTGDYTDFYLDIALTVLFFITIVLIRLQASNRTILFVFYLPFIIIFSLGFVARNGLGSSTESNVYFSIILIALSMKGRLPAIFCTLLIMSIIMGNIYLHQTNGPPSSFGEEGAGIVNFAFLAIATILISHYAKNVFSGSRKQLKDTATTLRNKSEEIAQKNKELILRREELERLNKELSQKVQHRTEELRRQGKSMEKYLELTLKELTIPYQKTIAAIEQLEKVDNSKVTRVMSISGKKLKNEVEQLRNKLSDEHK